MRDLRHFLECIGLSTDDIEDILCVNNDPEQHQEIHNRIYAFLDANPALDIHYLLPYLIQKDGYQLISASGAAAPIDPGWDEDEDILEAQPAAEPDPAAVGPAPGDAARDRDVFDRATFIQFLRKAKFSDNQIRKFERNKHIYTESEHYSKSAHYIKDALHYNISKQDISDILMGQRFFFALKVLSNYLSGDGIATDLAEINAALPGDRQITNELIVEILKGYDGTTSLNCFMNLLNNYGQGNSQLEIINTLLTNININPITLDELFRRFSKSSGYYNYSVAAKLLFSGDQSKDSLAALNVNLGKFTLRSEHIAQLLASGRRQIFKTAKRMLMRAANKEGVFAENAYYLTADDLISITTTYYEKDIDNEALKLNTKRKKYAIKHLVATFDEILCAVPAIEQEKPPQKPRRTTPAQAAPAQHVTGHKRPAVAPVEPPPAQRSRIDHEGEDDDDSGVEFIEEQVNLPVPRDINLPGGPNKNAPVLPAACAAPLLHRYNSATAALPLTVTGYPSPAPASSDQGFFGLSPFDVTPNSF